MDNIAGYVYDHATCDERRWHGLEADHRGPYFVSATYEPSADRFVELIRLHVETKRCCNPLDGQEHSFSEMKRWIGIGELALRFIGLGVILGVFELVRPWEKREGETREELIQRLESEEGSWFKLKARHRREPALRAFQAALDLDESPRRHGGTRTTCPHCGAARRIDSRATRFTTRSGSLLRVVGTPRRAQID